MHRPRIPDAETRTLMCYREAGLIIYALLFFVHKVRISGTYLSVSCETCKRCPSGFDGEFHVRRIVPQSFGRGL